VRTEHLQASRRQDIERAAALLRQGRIVAFPTETVYGLGARADDAEAIEGLRRVKGRPGGKPFAVLVPTLEAARQHGVFGQVAERLAAAFWPGPLTLVVPDGRGGDVGLRCPDCEPTLELLRLAGFPVAAPSANPSGRPPATTPDEVIESFDGQIAAVLDGGPCRLGAPSTVVRVLGEEIEVLREGMLSADELRSVLSNDD